MPGQQAQIGTILCKQGCVSTLSIDQHFNAGNTGSILGQFCRLIYLKCE